MSDKRSKNILQRIRHRLAPAGSRANEWIFALNRNLYKLRTASLYDIVYRLSPAFVRRRLKQQRLKSVVLLQTRLAQIIQQFPPDTQIIVFPPSLDWNVQLFQRPQQLARALAKQGALVFYLQLKAPGNRQAPSERQAFELLQERLYLCNMPVEAFAQLRSPFIYILTWNSKYISEFDAPRILYDFVDEIETFYGDHARMRRDHAMLLQRAELVIATAERLHQKVVQQRPDAILCPNGVDHEHFSLPHKPVPPADLEPILGACKPIIGYYGALAQWFDYELLTEVAGKRSDLSFVLIGPDYDRTLTPQLSGLPNVTWLGVKHYQELPRYAYYFDVAIIPFRLNEITHSVSPLKLFEYMSAGKVIVTTPLHESLRYPCVLIASDASEFSQKLDQALKIKDDPDYNRLVISTAQQNTWEARAKQILNMLSSKR